MKHPLLALAVILAASASASAQSTIVGLDVRLNRFFETNTADFVGNFQTIAGNSENYYAMDFDVTATTLYVIRSSDSEMGTLDRNSGNFTSLGLTNLPPSSVTGMTADPDGVTFWVVASDPTAAGSSGLFRGDFVTGIFHYVGVIVTRPSTIIPDDFIDIACSSTGDLYAYSIKDDSLYSVNRTTGAGTRIGASGYPTNYAQGMDFDWSTDTLYATLYDTGGSGRFVSFNLATGANQLIQHTSALNAEMEMAVEQPLGSGPGVPFCDPANPNSTGFPVELSATGNPGTGAGLHLDGISGPPNQFAYFLVGTAAQDPGTTISQGELCLSLSGGNSLGRYNLLGTDRNSLGQFDAAGNLQNLVGTSQTGYGFDIPTILPLLGSPTIQSGSTYHFQLWYRESGGVSNFSNGLSLSF
ncbi:MAG: hypothetical protein H6830_06700 [Planctomycetes bacterium]|nr:hypothetical protein [Planctomycetota bacterium]MCB9911275.1 hypothetical protein [Planctomycetota bacterium]MCB9911538.1 hypothetical protein [Planctomycetota bacterium]HRV80905.1 hypothetical protein [Planctomycetota bacterium]